MNRYTIEDPNPGTPTTYRIYGPDGAMIGTLFGEGEAETERLKRWIEAAPKSDSMMNSIICGLRTLNENEIETIPDRKEKQ